MSWTHLVAFHHTAAAAMLQARTFGQLGLLLAMAGLIGPIVKEIYFRGLFLVWLRRKTRLPVAAGLNAVLFALVHGALIANPNLQGLVTTIGIASLGLVNVLWTVRTGSLWPAFIAHATFNSTQVLIGSSVLWLGHAL